MLGVAWIGDDLEETLVTRSTPRHPQAAELGHQQSEGGARRGIDGDQALQIYPVPPAVDKVVYVDEALIGGAAEVAEPDRGLVERAGIIFEL
jgi:hypothetical protein